MAWNEPGGGGDKKDPWGQNNGGPPDLDEVFRNLQRKLGKLMGGSGNKPSGPGGSSGVPAMGPVIGLVAVAAFAFWVYNCFYIIGPAERGVTTRFGAYQETTSSGLHFRIWPIDTLTILNVDQNRSIKLESESVLTQDENIVVVDLTVQYTIKNPEKYLFRVANPDATLKGVTESALREIIGKNTMDYIILQGRDDVANITMTNTQDIIDQYETGILVTAMNMTKAQPPEPVQAAFDDANKAREDKERFINEAEAYSNSVVPRARGDARKVTEDAKAYKESVASRADGESSRFTQILAEYEKAPRVMADRLYIDAMESVLQKSSKVLLSGDENSNNMMYLPLDKLLSGDGRARSSASDSYAADNIEPSENYTPTPIYDREAVSNRSRSRGRGE